MNTNYGFSSNGTFKALNHRKSAQSVVLGLFLLAFSLGAFWPGSARATQRYWTGAADANWSNPTNWFPMGAPTNYDELLFTVSSGSPIVMNNDIIGLLVGGLTFASNSYEIAGNGITLDYFAQIQSQYNNGSSGNQITEIDCPLIFLGNNYVDSGSGSYGLATESTFDLYLNGPITVVGASNTLYLRADGVGVDGGGHGRILVGGQISGAGSVLAYGLSSGGHDASVEFNGAKTNTFTGTMYIATTGNSQIVFNKSAGTVVSNCLSMDSTLFGYTSPVNLVLNSPGQVNPNATLIVNSGGTLALSGNSLTVSNLMLTNYPTDGAGSSIDTGSTTLNLTGGITTSVNNSSVHPTIKGTINLENYAPFNANGGPQPALEIPAVIQGLGFSVTGNGLLELEGNNTFTGDVFIESGTVEAYSSTAFGPASSTFGVHLDGGSLILQAVAIGTEALYVNSASSFLTTYNQCSWAGPVTLNTDLNLIPVDPTASGKLMTFSGAITGTGGLNLQSAIFGSGNVQLTGTGGNLYSGTTTVNCQLLEFNKPHGVNAYGGPLVVGSGTVSATCEARWLQDYQNVQANVTVYANGLVNLNNHYEEFNNLTFTGGEVDTGAGQVSLYGQTTANTSTASAVINGNVSLPSVGSNNLFYIYPSGGPACALSINANIMDVGTLTKYGQGTLCLNGSNSYIGPTFVYEGILSANTSSALGGTGEGTVVYNGATLQMAANLTFSEPLSLTGTGFNGMGALNVTGQTTFNSPFPTVDEFDLGGAATIRVEGSGSTFYVNGVIGGTGPLTKSGPGNMLMEGSYNNTYSGDTIVTDGTLEMSKPQFVVAVPGNLVLGPPPAGGVTALALFDQTGEVGGTTVTVNGNSLLNLNGNNLTVSQLNLNDGGSVIAATPGGLTLATGGIISVGSQTTGINGGSHVSSSINGNLGLQPNDPNVTINVNPYAIFFPFAMGPELDVPANVFINGSENPSLVPTAFTKNGSGAMRLNGNNNFKGFVTVNGGTLIVANANALSTGGNGLAVNNGATLGLEGGIYIPSEPLYLNSSNAIAFDNRTGSNTWGGKITLSQNAGINVRNAGDFLMALNIVTGPGGFTKTGPGTVRFWGFNANNYTGLTTVSQGVLEVGRVGLTSVPGDVIVGDESTSTTVATLRTDREQQFSPTANITVNKSGLFDVYPFPGVPVPSPVVGTVSGDGIVNVGTGTSLTVSNNTACVFSGQLNGPGTFTKTGTAKMQLTGNGSLTGSTTISKGILQVDGNLNQSTVSVSGGTLKGTGTTGTVSANGGTSTVLPGDSPGILNCGNFTGSGSAVFQVELNGSNPGTGYDQLNVQGTVNLSAGTVLSATLNYPSALSNKFTIIKNDGADAVVGTFKQLAEGATLTIGGQQFRISYVGGDGNDVVLTQTTGNPLPVLTIQPAPPNSVMLLWPTNSPGFTLQSTTNVSGGTWQPVLPQPATNGANYVVTNPVATGPLFFRLIK
jgi:fibronectin-binding autotransporter adhesin